MTVVLTIAVFATLMSGMAVGVIFGGKPLRGSCGGVGSACACKEAGTPGACKVVVVEPEFKPPGAIMTLRRR